MGYFTYADDISILCPTLSGMQCMILICEEYAFNFKITFKSQLLYFNYICTSHNELSNLKMQDGNIIPFVNKCVHLGTTIHIELYTNKVNIIVTNE